MKNIILLFAILLFTTNSHPAIITVKLDGTGDYTSIQAAYLAASSGDTVLVYPGIYFENLDINWQGKNITIASLNLINREQSYIYNTIIDGNKSGSTIKIRSNPETEIVIHGFTIRNGTGHGKQKRGGGIFIDDASPAIVNCIIEHNTCLYGGGISANKSLLYLSGTNIRNNIARITGGGLVMQQNVIVNFDTINKCNIYLNHAGSGSDIRKAYLSPAQAISLDTFTVANPNNYFILSTDNWGFPVNDLTVQISHGLVDPLQSNLFVDPIIGSNMNSGLTPEEPLRTICFAYKKIIPDTINSTNIFLANGIYSPSANGEIFPVQARSYVNIIGTDRENTILDAELTTFLFYGTNLTENYSIKNIAFCRGAGDTLAIGARNCGILLNFNKNCFIDSIFMKNNSGAEASLILYHTDNADIRNVEISECIGGALSIGYSYPTIPSKFHIENLKISDNIPDYSLGFGMGYGLIILGKLTNPYLYNGSVTNLQITNNIYEPDPMWGKRNFCSLGLGDHAIVDIVNATLGHNILIGQEGYAAGLTDGAKLNLYNSIFYYDSLYEIVLGNQYPPFAPVTANICYSNIEGGPAQIYNWNNQHTLNWLEGNINKNPMWAGDGKFPYQLQSGSPCKNAGTPMYEPGMQPPYIKLEDEKIVLYKIDGDTLHLPLVDLAGKPRISGGRIDMGAYEFQDTLNLVPERKRTENDVYELQIYPNPFYAHAMISLRLKTSGKLVASISDIHGRHIKTLLNTQTQPGEYNMIWQGNDDNGSNVPKGTYFITLYHNDRLLTSGKIVRK